jgi:hypothetical protein
MYTEYIIAAFAVLDLLRQVLFHLVQGFSMMGKIFPRAVATVISLFISGSQIR